MSHQDNAKISRAMFDATVLIIDDDLHIRRAVRRVALLDASRVLEAGTARDGIDIAASASPDLVVLDLELPDQDGLQVCRELRRWSGMPIVVLSGRDSDRDKVRLLDAGADDFVIKPFSAEELGARFRVQLRRAFARGSVVDPTTQTYGHLTVDLSGRTVRRSDRAPGELVRLTPIEWNLLTTMIARSGRTLTHANLREQVWDDASKDPRHDIRVHIANLRRKIERDPTAPELIITESGVGYRFERPA